MIPRLWDSELVPNLFQTEHPLFFAARPLSGDHSCLTIWNLFTPRRDRAKLFGITTWAVSANKKTPAPV